MSRKSEYWAGALLIGLATGVIYLIDLVLVGTVVLAALGGIVGFLWRRFAAIALAPVPWVVGLTLGFVTGRYEYLGEYWWLAAAMSTLALGTGILGGLLLSRLNPA